MRFISAALVDEVSLFPGDRRSIPSVVWDWLAVVIERNNGVNYPTAALI
jgi:hypothetical protein